MTAPDDDVLAAAIDLIALLRRSGYVVLTRHLGPWWECLVEGHDETWVGRGSTDDQALQDVLKRMCASWFARDLARARIAAEAPAPAPAPPAPAPVTATTKPRAPNGEATTPPLSAPPAPAAVATLAAPPAPVRAAGLASVEARLRQRLRVSKVLMVCEPGDRHVAATLGIALDATVVCCDRGSDQQARAHLKKLRVYDAIVVHGVAAKGPFAGPAAAAKIPVAEVRVLGVANCIAALAEACGLESAPPQVLQRRRCPRSRTVTRSTTRSAPASSPRTVVAHPSPEAWGSA